MNGVQSIPVDRMIEGGYKCPQHTAPELDWAVLKLKWAAKGVRPYRVSRIKTGWIRVGDTVLSVCHSYDFKPEMSSPKHAGFCKVRMVYHSPLAFYLGTDCDAGSACSGGSLLSGNEDDPVLLAIARSVGETKEMEAKALRRGRPNSGAYDERNWATHYVLVAGDFLEALRRATATDPVREWPAKPGGSD